MRVLNSVIARWKRCIGQDMREGLQSCHALSRHATSQNLHKFTNWKLSKPHTLGIFMESSFYAAAAAKSLQSDSMRSHRRQPTRLPHSWDSLGKNTGVGCHFLLQCMKMKSQSEVAQCPTLSNPMDCSLRGSSIHGIFQARVLE